MKKRRVNTYRLLMSLAVLPCIAGVTAGVHSLQSGRSARVFLAQSERASSEGDNVRAVRSLRSAVRLDPLSSDLRAKYGALLFQLGDVNGAYFELEDAVRLNPGDKTSRKLASQCAMRLKRYDDALDHLNAMLSDEENAEVLDLLGQCQAACSDVKSARSSFERAIVLDPTSVESYWRLATILAAQGMDGEAEADAVIKDMIDRNPDSSRAHLIEAYFALDRAAQYQRQQNTKKAMASHARSLRAAQLAVAKDDQSFEGLKLLAVLELSGGQLEAARNHAEQLRKQQPSSIQSYLLLSEIELNAREREAAIDWLRLGIRETGIGNEPLHINLAGLLLDGGRMAEGLEVVERLRSTNAPTSMLGLLDARIKILQKDWLSARTILQTVKSGLVGDAKYMGQAELLLGICYRNLGQPQNELAALQRSVDIDPNLPLAKRELITTLRGMGNIEAASALSKDLARLDSKSIDHWVQVAELSIDINRRIPVDQQNWQDFHQAFKHLKELQAKPIVPAQLEASALAAQGRSEEAHALLQSFLDQTTDRSEWLHAFVVKAGMLTDGKRWKEVESLIDRAKSEYGSDVRIRQIEAQKLASQHGSAASPHLLALNRDASSLTSQDALGLRSMLARLAIQQNCDALASTIVDELVKDFPDETSTWLLQFDLALRHRSAQRLGPTLERLHAMLGEGPIWHYGKAVEGLLSANGQTHSADFPSILRHIDLAMRERSDWPRLHRLKGDILFLQGERDEAANEYLSAIEHGETDTAVYQRCLQVLVTLRRIKDAARIIGRINDHNLPLGAGLGRLASSILLETQQTEQALELARCAVQSTGDPIDAVWLAQLALKLANGNDASQTKSSTGNLSEEAGGHLRKAIQVDSRCQPAWAALVSILRRQQRVDEAREVVSQAKSHINYESEPIFYAGLLEEVGDLTEARRLYERSTEKSNDTNSLKTIALFHMRQNQPLLALPHLERLRSSSNLGREDVLWVNRNLALVYLSKGLTHDFDRALEFVNENLIQVPDSVADLRIQAMILSSHRTSKQRASAIEKWLRVLALSTPPAAEDQYRLAEVYLQENDWPNAAKHLRDAISASTSSERERYMTQYIRGMLQQQELEEAKLWIGRLAVSKPDAARIFEAVWLSRRGRYEESLNLFKEAKLDENTLVEAITMLQFILYRKDLPRKQFEELGSIIEKLAIVHQATVSLQVLRASYWQHAGEPEKANAFFQQVVERDPNNVVALNNYALSILDSGGDVRQAAELADKCLKLAGRQAPLLDTRATVALVGEEFDIALGLLDEALAHSEEPAYVFHKAVALSRKGNRNQAVESLRSAEQKGLRLDLLSSLERKWYRDLAETP